MAFDGNSRESYVKNLKNDIIECIEFPDEVDKRGKNARNYANKYTWKEKTKISANI